MHSVFLAIAAALAARIVVVTVRAGQRRQPVELRREVARTCPPVDDQTRFLKIVDDMRRKGPYDYSAPVVIAGSLMISRPNREVPAA